MKKVILISCMFTTIIGAEINAEVTTDVEYEVCEDAGHDNVVILHTSGCPGRPSSYAYIEGRCGRGFIEFRLPAGIHHLSVVVSRPSGSIYDIALVEEVSAENPRIYFHNLRGTHFIECTADDGTVFTGTCEL